MHASASGLGDSQWRNLHAVATRRIRKTPESRADTFRGGPISARHGQLCRGDRCESSLELPRHSSRFVEPSEFQQRNEHVEESYLRRPERAELRRTVEGSQPLLAPADFLQGDTSVVVYPGDQRIVEQRLIERRQ